MGQRADDATGRANNRAAHDRGDRRGCEPACRDDRAQTGDRHDSKAGEHAAGGAEGASRRGADTGVSRSGFTRS
jgi:hypothetical protein